jgi:DNA-binding NarL/FixJ family response regulator
MNKINLAIIEDTEEIRLNLQEFFSNEPGFNCIACVDNMEEFLEDEDYDALPDIVLSDVGLPGKTGIEGIALIRRKYPETEVVLLTVFNENDKVFSALRAGAAGYILKGTPLSEIRDALVTVFNGGSYMSPAIARKVISFFSPVHFKNERLTDRESEVVKALADGLSYKLIADKMNLSTDSIRFHIKNIYKKLQVNSKAEVIRKVYRWEV